MVKKHDILFFTKKHFLEKLSICGLHWAESFQFLVKKDFVLINGKIKQVIFFVCECCSKGYIEVSSAMQKYNVKLFFKKKKKKEIENLKLLSCYKLLIDNHDLYVIHHWNSNWKFIFQVCNSENALLYLFFWTQFWGLYCQSIKIFTLCFDLIQVKVICINWVFVSLYNFELSVKIRVTLQYFFFYNKCLVCYYLWNVANYVCCNSNYWVCMCTFC